MSKTWLRYLFMAFLVVLPAISAGADPEMDPAPEDWSKFKFKREPGTFKRSAGGLIDPTPDVISLQHLPKDKYGFVDWAQAMRDGLISPKSALKGESEAAKAEEAEVIPDILIKSKMAFMPDVIFPHAPHTAWLKCSTCHPKIFKAKAGGNPISMVAIWKGRFCGRCHDKVAFPIRNCFKCHSVPRKKAKK